MSIRLRQVTCPGDKAFGGLWPRGASTTAQTPYAFDQVIQRFPRLARVDGQRHQPFGHALSHRELPFAKAPLPKSRGVMQRRVMRARSDAFLVQHRMDEIVPGPAKLFGVDLDGVKMENMFASRADGRQRDSRNFTKSR